jgi:hypothetical protein
VGTVRLTVVVAVTGVVVKKKASSEDVVDVAEGVDVLVVEVWLVVEVDVDVLVMVVLYCVVGTTNVLGTVVADVVDSVVSVIELKVFVVVVVVVPGKTLVSVTGVVWVNVVDVGAMSLLV